MIFKQVFPTFIITGCVLTAINSWNETLNSGLSTLYIAAWTIFIIAHQASVASAVAVATVGGRLEPNSKLFCMI